MSIPEAPYGRVNNFSGSVKHHILLDLQNDCENPGIGLQKSKILDLGQHNVSQFTKVWNYVAHYNKILE